jgi:hypothetical protein
MRNAPRPYDPNASLNSEVFPPQTKLTTQEGVLALGMSMKNTKASTNYQLDATTGRTIPSLPDRDFTSLVNKFKSDPKEMLAFGRENIFGIMRDRSLPLQERQERVKRYVDAFLALQLKLDVAAFPETDAVSTGVPEYIPDGLSDMGSDPNPDPNDRSREKIRVGKEKMFKQSKELFYEIFSLDTTGRDSTEMKKYIAKRVAAYVYNSMAYDYANQDPFASAQGGSIPLNAAMEKKLAVCRHHAMYSQVLLQAFGLTTRLLKCDVDLAGTKGRHVANLVRVNGEWFIMDSTNPDIASGDLNTMFLKPIGSGDIDTTRKDYTWRIPRGNPKGKQLYFTYKSHNKMYSRIKRDNLNYNG